MDGSGRVVAGHARLAAARQLGWAEVPTISMAHLSDAQRRAYMVADNRLNEISTWDDRLLGETLRELSLQELDFSLEVTGFDIPEIDFRIEGLDPPAAGADPADLVPELPGGHGNPARRSLAVGRSPRDLRQRARAELLRRPDGRQVGGDGVHRPTLQRAHRGTRLRPGRDPPSLNSPWARRDVAEQFTDFLARALGHAARHSTDGSLHYCLHGLAPSSGAC